MEEERKTYEWIRETMRKANQKYRNSNRERFNQMQKNFYDAHKGDEEYMQKRRKNALEYYYRKKAEKAEKEKQKEAQSSVLEC